MLFILVLKIPTSQTSQRIKISNDNDIKIPKEFDVNAFDRF
jgi:hypothetical protein